MVLIAVTSIGFDASKEEPFAYDSVTFTLTADR